MKLTLDELRLLRLALREAAGSEAQTAQANRPAFREPNAEARKAARAAEEAARRMMRLHRRICDEISRAESRVSERWSQTPRSRPAGGRLDLPAGEPAYVSAAGRLRGARSGH